MSSDLKPSMDDRRMQISRNELNHVLDGDTLGVIISYARYTESEKVLLALQKNIYIKDESDYIRYRKYSADPAYLVNKYGSDDDSIEICVCSMWISNFGHCHNDQSLKYVKPPLFTLGFGSNVFTFMCFPITLNDLLPNPDKNQIGLAVDEPLLEIFNICMPMYLADIKSEIDKI